MVTDRITLAWLRSRYSGLFYVSQTWYLREVFYDAPLEVPLRGLPTSIGDRGVIPPEGTWLPTAVELAELYVRTADAPVWQNYLWTADLDRDGQRVFMGVNGQGLEIHRHLAITDRWGVPLW